MGERITATMEMPSIGAISPNPLSPESTTTNFTLEGF